jgi:hypothetical protein
VPAVRCQRRPIVLPNHPGGRHRHRLRYHVVALQLSQKGGINGEGGLQGRVV